MTKIIFTIISILFYCNTVGQNISKSILIKDLTFLNEAFKNGHPLNLSRIKTINFANSIDQINKQLPDTITKITFENTVRRILFELGCVHTSIESWSREKKVIIQPKLLPFNIFCDGNKLWMHSPTNDSLRTQIKKGDEILFINNNSAKEIIDILKYYHPVDGHSSDFNLNLINKKFPLLLYKCVDRTNSYIIQYKSIGGFVKKETFNNNFKSEDKNNVKLPIITLQGNNEFLSFVDDSIAILTIKSFHKKSRYFYKSVFNYLNSNKIKNLIIDVRDNLGGSRSNASELISYITDEKCKFETIRPKNNLQPYLKGSNKFKFMFSYIYYDLGCILNRRKTKEGVVFISNIAPKKNRYVGNTYVLVNGFTSSSASLLTSYIKHHGKAFVIGQQTGGGEFSNNGGSYPNITLPNSGLIIKTATYFMRYDMSGENPNGIIPHYSIIYDINTYMVKDLEMEKALQLIQKTK